jgi:hypothetical protein
VVGVLALSRALAAGGEVIWQPPERPRLRVGLEWAEAIRREAPEVREVLRRAAMFRRQIKAAEGRAVLPLLMLPEAAEPHVGACISCGAEIANAWRCLACLVAVYVALGAVPPLTGAQEESPEFL